MRKCSFKVILISAFLMMKDKLLISLPMKMYIWLRKTFSSSFKSKNAQTYRFTSISPISSESIDTNSYSFSQQ